MGKLVTFLKKLVDRTKEAAKKTWEKTKKGIYIAALVITVLVYGWAILQLTKFSESTYYMAVSPFACVN